MKTNKTDLVSVIVPVYNVERHLRECLNSLVGQTYKNKEIVEKKMNEVGIEADQECFSDRFNNFIDEAKVNLIKGEYRFILTETDVINRTIHEKI